MHRIHAATHPELSPQPKVKILVAHQNRFESESIAGLLRTHGYEAFVAFNDRQTFDVAATVRPEVILLDVAMPRVTGYEIVREIRANQSSCHALIVAMIGRQQLDERSWSIRAGFDHHLVEPIDIAALHGVVRKRPPARETHGGV